jgi:hypothetical protein
MSESPAEHLTEEPQEERGAPGSSPRTTAAASAQT